MIVRPPLGRTKATLLYGKDVLEALASLPEDSVHTVVTSPPYFGLRDYGGLDQQIGLEATVGEYIDKLVAVFDAVKRVLRPDGTVWLNLGDSYDSKDLIGVPWRVALALQADGWYLRNEIIWAKKNCLPESVTDRCTRSHEHIFLLAHPDSNGKYFYDADAIRKPHTAVSVARMERKFHRDGHKWEAGPGDQTIANKGDQALHPKGANRRDVWHIAPRSYPGAHFAVFPPEIPERAIKAGSSEKGACSVCGSPWRRVSDKTSVGRQRSDLGGTGGSENRGPHGLQPVDRSDWKEGVVRITLGWEPTCSCDAADVPAVVLDPFSGSATTGKVATTLGRDYIGIDLNAEYLPLAQARILGAKAPQVLSEDDTTPFEEDW